ncbi:hypothetical protein BUALT_Bualt08G0088600 [Buddleja alternifolia]|uniref:Uncharacterized protein n=1 Tax=Buddleja alternifolia TaxID=168488 RepID=A0AAV6X6F2_9LAMI|nr:hypothetical protein BUALT_Bualt08G0088600 [Buddleja alternifolia]
MMKMSHMKKMLWTKLKLHIGTEGRHGKRKEEDNVNSLMGKPNVNEEYKEAFRTKSFIEMCNKVQGQLEVRTSLDDGQSSSSSSPLSSSSSTPSSPSVQHVPLSQYLLEPRQETLTSILEASNLHQFLVNYFEISLEAGKTCEFLLQNVLQVHINYRVIKNVLKLIKRVPDKESWTHHQYHAVYKNLASYALHKNPFSMMTREKFHELHDSHVLLLHQLTSQYRKTKRRTKYIRFIKRAFATFLVLGFGAFFIALLILAMHSMIGLVACPGLIVCTLALFKTKRLRQKFDRKWLEGLGAQLDIAARGVYILINDFDTMSMLVQRLYDEMEHRKFVADICVKKGKNEMLKEVVTEFQTQDSCFLEQLEELEKQIYLCFLDINRSRRLVVDEMVKC